MARSVRPLIAQSMSPTIAQSMSPTIGRWPMLLALLLPLTQLVKADFGGTFFGQDLLGAAMLPVLLMLPGARARLTKAKIFFILLGIWFFGQVFTDVIRGTGFQDYSRGWAKIIFFGLQFTVLWLFLTRDFKLFLGYFAGASVVMMLRTRQLDEVYQQFPWKFGLGLGILTLVSVAGSVYVARFRDGSMLPAVALIVAGVVALVKGARNVFGTGLFAGMYVYIVGLISARPGTARAVSPRVFVLFIVMGILFSQMLISTYGIVAGAGYLGLDAQLKYQDQSRGDVSIIQGGRVESLVSTIAIKDSPIIGHGSWAHDIYYVRLFRKRLADLGLGNAQQSKEISDLIPTHSHLLGAWVEAGIAGGLFWGWALLLCLTALYHLLKLPRLPSPMIVTAAFSMMWDIPFSPFGADQRFIRAAQIAVLLYVVTIAKAQRAAGAQSAPRMKMGPLRARSIAAAG